MKPETKVLALLTSPVKKGGSELPYKLNVNSDAYRGSRRIEFGI